MNPENKTTIYHQNGLALTDEKGHINEQSERTNKKVIYHDKTFEELVYEDGRLVQAYLYRKRSFWEKLLHKPAQVLKETHYEADGRRESWKYHPKTGTLAMGTVLYSDKSKDFIICESDKYKKCHYNAAGKVTKTEMRSLQSKMLIASTEENSEKKIDCFYTPHDNISEEQIYFKKTGKTTFRYYKKSVLIAERREEEGRTVWRQFFNGKKLSYYWKELAGGSFIGEQFDEKGRFVGWCFAPKNSRILSSKCPVKTVTYPTKEKVYQAFVGELIDAKMADGSRLKTLRSLREIKSLSARKCWMMYLKSLQNSKE